MSDEQDDYIEVKVHRDGVTTTTARKAVKQKVKMVVSGHEIQPGAKKILKENKIKFYENVDASDLDTDSEVE